jgi:FAD synthetase
MEIGIRRNVKNLKVMVFGTFDRLHEGHLDFFRKAKRQGEYLIVVIARNRTVREVKGRAPKYSEKERAKFVKNSGAADKVVMGHLKNKMKVIEKYNPDIICLGYDQTSFTESLGSFLRLKKFKVKIKRLKPFKPEIYKSSKIK